jgi:hypothetical protein
VKPATACREANNNMDTINISVTVQEKKGALNSDLLWSPQILMKRCYHYTDEGHQFTCNLGCIRHILYFPPTERRVNSPERGGMRGSPPGEVEGAG